MSINQPKPLQIRLPFTVPKPGRTQAQPRVCGICRQQDSKYTCPRCNITYCSLQCFQSQSHSQCSEPFYKSTVLTQIAADPDADFESKRQMLDMLRRFEESQADDAADDDDGEGSDDEEGEAWDELSERLADVDLDHISSNELFHLLPPSHRETFLSALRNPNSEQARTLLDLAAASGESDGPSDPLMPPGIPSALPWWENAGTETEPSEDGDGDGDQDGGGAEGLGGGDSTIAPSTTGASAGSIDGSGIDDEASEEDGRGPGRAAQPAEISAARPDPIPAEVLEAISPPPGVGKKLAYNAISLAMAYVHTLLTFRLPSLSPAYIAEASPPLTPSHVQEYIGKLVPFLVEPRSTERYDSFGNAWGSVWERIGQEQGRAHSQSGPVYPRSTLLHLFPILAQFLHPPILAAAQPLLFPLLADLYRLFTTAALTPQTKIKSGGEARKLAFYTVALAQLERNDWLALEREVEGERRRLERELDGEREGDIESGTREGRQGLRVV